ncbi:MAG: ABC transporter permease, partial [Negativicoccus succinicivorans]|nr:ABC transporter permease [Negativicoccus succinicivorans]
MKFRTFLYFLKEAFRSFFRNGWMTIASILTVTLSLFILGMFMTTVWNLNHAASYLENQVELSVYLKDGLTSEQIHAVEQKIKS